MLQGKTVLLCVTGGIAAYKMPNVARMLKKMHCRVHVLMTENATNFITATTFETLTGNKCLIDTFDRNFEFSVEHVALAKQADLVLLAPATANVIGKIANGIADDMLTTTVMACTCKILLAPAMNHNMYHNAIVQDNLKKLEQYGYLVIPPVHGMLANGDSGDGKLPSEDVLVEYVKRELAHSTGKMGYALANQAMLRGAQVTLVTGVSALTPPMFTEVVPVVTAKEMYQEVIARASEADIIIKAAAVADYRPSQVAEDKIKKSEEDAYIALERTRDILGELGSRKARGELQAYLCGFSMETRDLEENSRAKLAKKHLDMVAANNLKVEGAGFGADTNVLTLITDSEVTRLEKMTKEEAADKILDRIAKEIFQSGTSI